VCNYRLPQFEKCALGNYNACYNAVWKVTGMSNAIKRTASVRRNVTRLTGLCIKLSDLEII